jgi:predicted RNA-binding Zn-ribbon protein involved in translation (DUF1610 family)
MTTTSAASMPETYEIRVCAECAQQVSYDPYAERWICPEHGRDCMIRFLTVVPVDSEVRRSDRDDGPARAS